MTTCIRVNADSGKAIRVRGADPTNPGSEAALDRTIPVGGSDYFYVHAHMAIVIEEVQPEPEPEAIDATQVAEQPPAAT